MEELFKEPDDLQTICIRQLHHTCTRLSPPIYRDVRDVLVTLPSPIIYLYRDHLFEAMWDEVDFKLFTLFDLCKELLRQRELTSPTSVTLLDRCRTDVVRICGHLSFSQIHAIMSRFPPDFGSTRKSLQQVQLGIGDERCHKKHTDHTIIPRGRGRELCMNVVQPYKTIRSRVFFPQSIRFHW